ncbi:hypothetical protein EV210_101213 [Anaerospora hongkongensis]|uniref:Uncharacterized protein n=1 Tax=Anaerospora hongkongensis TaxID=244830 RepID=A0A4V2Q936_9FIRM|nr:hypothetical protein [Anaerospora hongkongensis]TCL40013.1 hypothetical protein EV210_101213 [Anaerospora hongkongensis]
MQFAIEILVSLLVGAFLGSMITDMQSEKRIAKLESKLRDVRMYSVLLGFAAENLINHEYKPVFHRNLLEAAVEKLSEFLNIPFSNRKNAGDKIAGTAVIVSLFDEEEAGEEK